MTNCHRSHIHRLIRFAARLQLNNRSLGAHFVDALASVVAVAAVHDLVDPQDALVDVVAQGRDVGVVYLPVALEDDIAKGPVESRTGEGLHLAADDGSLVEIKGHFVVLVDDDGRVLDPEQHRGVSFVNLVLHSASVLASIGRHELITANPVRADILQGGDNIVRHGGGCLVFRRGDLVQVGLDVEDLSAVLEPPDDRFGLAHRRASDQEARVSGTLHDGRLQLGDDLGSLVDSEIYADRLALSEVVRWLAMVFSSMAQASRVNRVFRSNGQGTVASILPPTILRSRITGRFGATSQSNSSTVNGCRFVRGDESLARLVANVDINRCISGSGQLSFAGRLKVIGG